VPAHPGCPGKEAIKRVSLLCREGCTCCVQGYMIVLEEEVLPTADFLQFMAQCLDVVVKDSSLIGASAWNDNGQ